MKWLTQKTFRTVVTAVFISTAAVGVLKNASELEAFFEPEDYKRFQNENDDSGEYDYTAGDGEHSDLADKDEDGKNSGDNDEETLQIAEDKFREGADSQEGPGIADPSGTTGEDSNVDAMELVNSGGADGIGVQPGNGGAVVGSGPNSGTGNQAGEGSGTNTGTGTVGEGIGNGNGNGEASSGEGGQGSSGVHIDEKEILAWEQEQLKPKDPIRTEYGELIGLDIEFQKKFFYPGEVFQTEDAIVSAVFKDTDKKVTLPYGGSDGYRVSLPTSSKGKHYAVFSYMGISERKEYTVLQVAVKIKYHAMLEESPQDYYTADFPGDPIKTLLGDDGDDTWGYINGLSEQWKDDLNGGNILDLSEFHHRMIAYLGNPEVGKAFKDSGSADSYSSTRMLPEENGYLTAMLEGFYYVDTTRKLQDKEPYIYYPVFDWGTVSRNLVNVVREVPDGYKIRRVVENEDDWKDYRGSQVLEGYSGGGTELSVPAGVTRIDLKEISAGDQIERLVLPQSVEDIQTESIAKCLPKLKEYAISGAEDLYRNYRVINGVLCSADGTVLLSVPAGKESFQWPETVTTIAPNAFYGCRIANLKVPGKVTRLEGGCFLGLSADTIQFEGETVPEISDETGYRGMVIVPDSDYDLVYKNYMFAFQEECDKLSFGVVDAAGNQYKTDIYQYSSNENRPVLYDKSQPDVLAAIHPETAGRYSIDMETVQIGSGAFLGCKNLIDLEISGDTTKLLEGSLVLPDNVKTVTLLAKKVEISPKVFGSLATGKVPDVILFVQETEYEKYLEEWQETLDQVYGENTAKDHLMPVDSSFIYEGGAKYQKVTGVDGSYYRLVTVYEKDMTTCQVKEGTREIHPDAFVGCDCLEILCIPARLKELERGVFANCPALKAIAVNDGKLSDNTDVDAAAAKVFTTGNQFYGFSLDDQGVLYGKASDRTWTLIKVPTDISGTLDVKRETSVFYQEALKDCSSLDVIKIPDTALKEIGERCFENCRGLERAAFKSYSNLAVIGSGAFSGCTGLKILSLPKKITKLPDELCYGCVQLYSAEAEGANTIGDRAFYDCRSLWSVTNVLSNVEILGEQAFFGCTSLKKVSLPKTLILLGEECFGNCIALTAVEFTGKLTGISRYCFYGCQNLSSVIFSDEQKKSLKILGVQAFGQCKALTDLDLREMAVLTQMGEKTFIGCESLSTVKFPKNLEEVPDYCFEDCKDLSILRFDSENVTALGESVFGDHLPVFLHIWVSKEKLEEYLGVYQNVLDQVYGEGTAKGVLGEINENIEIIKGIFYEITNKGRVLKEASREISGDYTIPKDTIKIENEAFLNCDKLQGITLPESAEIVLGDRCFKGCTGLKEVIINCKVPEWGDEVFMDCTGISHVRMEKGEVKRIGTRAFKNCTGLDGQAVEILVPAEIWGKECFSGCTKLTAIVSNAKYWAEVREFEDSAFEGCSSLQAIVTTQYKKLEKIGKYVFKNCDSLVQPSIPESVTSIGEGCFEDCDNLKFVSFHGALEEYPDNCFKNCPALDRTGGTEAAFAGLKRIGNSTYEGCTSLGNTKDKWWIGRYSSLEEIGNSAFKGCKSLPDSTIAATVIKIGEGAFEGCSKMNRLTFQSETPPEISSFLLNTMADGFRILVPDSETENDRIYKVYLEAFQKLPGMEDVYQILDSVSDGAKDRNPQSVSGRGISVNGIDIPDNDTDIPDNDTDIPDNDMDIPDTGKENET